MWIEELPSGRWRGGFRLAGRKITKTFDYDFEATAWALEAEALAERAAASAATLYPPTEASPAALPVALPVAIAGRPVGVTVAQHGRDLLARRRGLLEPTTARGYSYALDAIVRTGMGHHRLAELRKSDVETWMTAMVTAGDGRSAINVRLKVLKMICKDAVAHQLAPVDPAAGLSPLTTDAGPDRILTRPEEAALLAAAPDTLVAPILAGVDAGLRWQEVYALTVGSVRPDGFLDVSAAVVRHGGTVIRPYTKGGRDEQGRQARVVPIGTDRLAAALALAVQRATVLDRAAGSAALLFPNRQGRVMAYQSHRTSLWIPTLAKAGITDRPGFHGLRHTYATRLAAEGVPRSELAKLLGHSDESTTKRYVHAGDDGRRLTLVRDALARSAA